MRLRLSQITLIAHTILGLLLFSGCVRRTQHARSINLQVIDGSTRRPLTGVNVILSEDSSYDLLTGRHKTMEAKTLISDKDGTIICGPLHKHWTSRLVFSHPGYAGIYGTYSTDSLSVALSDGLLYEPALHGFFVLKEPKTVVLPTNGVFLIRMLRNAPVDGSP